MPECNLTAAELTAKAEKKAAEVMERLKSLSFTIALAESCTAGLISGLLANTAGASSVLWGSFVCYMQEAKVSMLDLDNEKLLNFGLVSRETAYSMAKSALQKSGASVAVSVTGLAGPESDGKVPGGTIWTAIAKNNGHIETKVFNFTGSRNTVRILAAIAVLELILENCKI